MNVLHIVGGELTGGAARGAYWLHQALLALGVDSRVLTTSEETYGDGAVISVTASKKGKLLHLLRRQVDYAFQYLYPSRKRLIFSTGMIGYDFTRTDGYKQADIVHLHWICQGMVNVRHLGKISKPVVWTMRDMWPMTGGCHVAEALDCRKYKTGCGECPQLQSRHKHDLSHYVLKRKRKYIPAMVRMVGISRWLSGCARESELFKDFDVRTIHNNINTKDFFPVEKAEARKALGLPADRPIVLAGSINFIDFYKGFEDYLKAVRGLDPDVLLLFFGKLDPAVVESLEHDYVNLGFLHDIESLRLAYSAADVFVAPSHMDAFGKTLAESMACGTPVVCYDATGPKDIVDHRENGYRASAFDPEDLARGIKWVLYEADQKMLSERARNKAQTCFDSKVIARKYIALYESMLGD